MEIVARHLKERALAMDSASESEAELFGRSAFNRYYYSAYLTVKCLLQPIFKDLPRQHAGIPEYLRGNVGRELKKRKNRAIKLGDHVSTRITQDGGLAAIALAEVLTRGYFARVSADYHPELSVDFYHNGFKLNEVLSSEAESWPYKARQLSMSIITAMKQTDGS